MKSVLSCTIVFSLFLTAIASSTHAAEPRLASIFNGKNLHGWTVDPESQQGAWRVQDGIITLENLPDKKGSTLWTAKEYQDFVMEFDFKLGEGIVDTGIYLRTTKQQIQIGESGSLKRDMTGSPYIAGKGYPQEAEGVAKLLDKKGWNKMKIQAVGGVYTVWLNGEKVSTYSSDSAVKSGPIGIQLHGNRDMSAYFRNIKLAEIK